MNRQAFLGLVEKPQLLGSDTLEGLASIVADYPFFQAARMLYVKNLSDVESIKYNSILKSSAAFISHREKLYHLVYSTPSKVLGVTSPNSAVEAVEAPEMALETHPLEGNEDQLPTLVIVDSVQEKLEQELVEQEKLEQELVEQEKLEQDIDLISNVIADGDFSVELPKAIDYFEVSDKIDFSSIIKNTVVFDSVATKPEFKVVLPPESVVLDVPLSHYPSGDLLDFENENNVGYSFESEHSLLDLDESNGLTFSDWLIKMRQQRAEQEVLKSPKSDKMDLINNFLKAKPKIVPRMVDVSAHEALNKRTFDEPDSLLTETLANIYIKQKHYDKSIKIFEKLCLKYPEKNAYFANRISEVEKLINNNL